MNTANNFDGPSLMLWTKISNIDLRLIQNDLTRTLGWSHNKCEGIIAEYKKFMYLCITNTDKTKSLIPGKDVDEVWHAHILRTEKYVSDCNIAGKQYIHHLPTPSNAAPANPSEFENGTKYLYEKVFGSLPQSWIGISRTAECGSDCNDCRCGNCQGEKLADCGTCSYCGSCNGACGDDSAECQVDKLADCSLACTDECSVDKLATADFKTTLNFGEIKLRLTRKLGWTEKRTNDGIEDYKKFLKKVVDTSSNLVEHSEDVEKIWENHILYTRQYQTDCDAINPAGYIHHVPMVY
jgi:hypothetical protein